MASRWSAVEEGLPSNLLEATKAARCPLFIGVRIVSPTHKELDRI